MKKFTSWGEFVEVETVSGTYENVILCPSPDQENEHLLEYNNGEVERVKTNELKSIKRQGKEKYIIQ